MLENFINTLILLFILFISFYKKNDLHIELKHKKSQFNQDISLYYNYFQGKKNGYFLEIGAYDGITISNTYFFEKNFNWKGILIEGGEKNCKKLKGNSIYRKKSIIICSPICKTSSIDYNDDGYMGSIIHSNNTNHIRKCNTLKNITSFFKIKEIDLFSLDVEGSELEVLETFDFDVKVSHWMIEWNHLSKDTKVNIENLLNKNGYYIDKTYISPIDILFTKTKRSKIE